MLKKLSGFKKYFINFNHEAIEQAEIQIKYERYIEKEQDLVKRMQFNGKYS